MPGEGLLVVAAGQDRAGPGGLGQAAVRAGVGRGGLRGAARGERSILRYNQRGHHTKPGGCLKPSY